MKLTDLEPKWLIKDGQRVGILYHTPTRLEFESWFATMFANTPYGEQWDLIRAIGINPDKVHCSKQDCGWKVSGEVESATFETLSLTPSVDVRGVWHGHITNGEMRTVK